MGPEPRQSTHIVFCQVCGTSAPPADARADGWLVERWRVDPALFVVRCYRHISEWSLRSSAAGRTKEWRQKAQEGRRRAQEDTAPNMPLARPAPLSGPPGLSGEDLDYEPYWEDEKDG